MQSFTKKLFSILLAAIILAVPVIGNAAPSKNDSKKDFRVTTYVVANTVLDEKNVHQEDFDIITDVILFGCARFDENGNLNVDEQLLTKSLKNLRNAIGNRDIKITIALLGPSYNGESKDWNDQMKKQGRLHNKAFSNPELITSIVKLLDDYDLDGVQFDYEYPIDVINWFHFSKFLVSLDKQLGDKTLGAAVSDWDMKLSKSAIKALDHIELMLYDVFDDAGKHAPSELCKNLSKKIKRAGIPAQKVDFGLPFYSRPTDHSAYWYGYNSFADLLDENGFYHDDNINKDFWFNTPDVIADKTAYAFENNFGGVMIWHYACDFASSDPRSLLGAIGSTLDSFNTNSDIPSVPQPTAPIEDITTSEQTSSVNSTTEASKDESPNTGSSAAVAVAASALTAGVVLALVSKKKKEF